MSTKKQNNNRYNFVEINGKCYTKGTEIKIKHCLMGGRYSNYLQVTLLDNNYLNCPNTVFLRIHDENGKFVANIMPDMEDFLEAVDEIIVPVEVPYVSPQDKKYAKSDFEISGMIEMWVVYIFLMIVFSIFHGRIIFWAIISFFFFGIRSVMKKDGGYK